MAGGRPRHCSEPLPKQPRRHTLTCVASTALPDRREAFASQRGPWSERRGDSLRSMLWDNAPAPYLQSDQQDRALTAHHQYRAESPRAEKTLHVQKNVDKRLDGAARMDSSIVRREVLMHRLVTPNAHIIGAPLRSRRHGPSIQQPPYSVVQASGSR